MKLKDFLKGFKGCVDVYENVAELGGVALDWDCTKDSITEAGKIKFSKALNYEVSHFNCDYLIMDTKKTISNYNDFDFEYYETLPEELKNLLDFLVALSGYCTIKEYEKWFIIG